MTITHISDTALWMAEYRAMETARADPLFRDPFARRLAGERGARIVAEMPQARAMAWAMNVRTAVFDEIILDAVRRRGATQVVNLAAGLDARPWRLDLPAGVRWVDADFGDLLAYKASVIGDAPPRCAYEAAPGDLADAAARAALLARLSAEGRRTLVVTEGLLIYLEREQVRRLATDLAAAPGFAWWVIDLASPDLLKRMSRSWGPAVAEGRAPFRFAPEEGPDFYRPLGWIPAEVRWGSTEARRLHREMRLMWLWRLIGKLYPREARERFRRMSAFVLLERDAPRAAVRPGPPGTSPR